MGKIRAMSLFYKSIDNQLNRINEEHMTGSQEVVGSSPIFSTLKIKHLRLKGVSAFSFCSTQSSTHIDVNNSNYWTDSIDLSRGVGELFIDSLFLCSYQIC